MIDMLVAIFAVLLYLTVSGIVFSVSLGFLHRMNWAEDLAPVFAILWPFAVVFVLFALYVYGVRVLFKKLMGWRKR